MTRPYESVATEYFKPPNTDGSFTIPLSDAIVSFEFVLSRSMTRPKVLTTPVVGAAKRGIRGIAFNGDDVYVAASD